MGDDATVALGVRVGFGFGDRVTVALGVGLVAAVADRVGVAEAVAVAVAELSPLAVAVAEIEPLAVGRNVVADDKGCVGDEQPDTETEPRTTMAPKPTAIRNARGVRTLLRYPAAQS
ncbi:MAG TPA: hypothetical protein VGG16_01490 [Streptosporangiaceae bacterium]